MEQVRVAYAFTKSDYKTVILPVICYGLMAAPVISYARLPSLTVWVWLFLLQFNAANQMFNSDEDALNKPYRPIPAGLITVENTRILRWALVPVCLGLSWACDVLYPGLSLSAAFIVYNELGLGDYWFTKNFLNAVGLVSWNVGAAKIACGGNGFVNEKAWIAPYISIALIASTIHIQDFRDVVGDRKQGRATLPVVMPQFSRSASFILLVAWSLGLVVYWDLSLAMAFAFVLLGLIIAVRVVYLCTEDEDKVSLRLYMVWLCVGQILPFISSHIYS